MYDISQHRMPQAILEFIAKHGNYNSSSGWYSENGKLYIRK